MAVAVAAALAAPVAAFAQASNVQIYGVLDMSVHQQMMKSGNANTVLGTTGNSAHAYGAQNKNEVYSQSSRLGFKGTEDLGNGLKAWFQVESGVGMDGRYNPNVGMGNTFGGRNSALGLEGGFGNVFVGHWDTPYKAQLTSTMVPLGNGFLQHNGMLLGGGSDSTGTVPNIGTDCLGATASGNIANPATASNALCAQMEGNATSFHRRMSNVMQYWSPVIGGFQGKAAYVASSQAVDQTSSAVPTTAKTNRPGLISLSGNYNAGPLALGVAYERHQGFRATGNSTAASATATFATNADAIDTGTLLTSSYDFGMVKLSLNWERLRYGDTAPVNYAVANVPGNVVLGSNDFTRDGWFFGAAAPIGNGKALFGYSKTAGAKSCGSLGRGAGPNVTAGTAGTTDPLALNGTFACGSDTGATAWSIGYEYSLSKRTSVYTAYMNVDNNSLASFTPVVSKNNIAGQALAGASLAGQDQSYLNVGMKHAF